ncbi:NADH dehydrogenase [ubiquinone] 1 subunit C1, mitochondrial [Clupea harengus]|uniref:NADH dehydrogenase [ubiquinone] 1 subunit C1, mitochondrial n=1 Tax=Clupea harengus TaxID=7950 RepID=A0A6P3W518_CLUHA|nr:NADH dehydrogenase [ubiquinone] 1 subunit C1, mitochondrial [Clupea harengus]
MSLNRLLLRTATVSRTVTRSAFTASKRDTANPNWFRVGLAFATSGVLWAMLLRQHSVDVREHKAYHGIE